MKRIRLTKLNLRTKLFLLYFMTIFIPLIITTQIVLSISGKKIIQQTTNLVQDSTQQTSITIQGQLNQYVDMVNRLSYDQELINYLNPNRVYQSDLESIDAYAYYLKPVTFYDFNNKNATASLKIYFTNTTLLQDSNTFIFADHDVQNQLEYTSATAALGKLVWGEIGDQIYLSRAMYNSQRQFTAVVSVLISNSIFDSLTVKGTKSAQAMAVTDTEGKTIYSNSNIPMTWPIVRKLIESDQQVEPFDIKDDRTGQMFKVLIKKLGDGQAFSNWRLLTLIPLDQIIHEEVTIRKTLLAAFLLCLLFSSGMFIIALNRITARIKALVKKMQSSRNGEFSIIEDTGATDEIGVLTKSFNRMIENLQQSIIENYKVNLTLKDITIKKREAELYALQSQINPHFLFNTLESIRMGLHNKGDQETSSVVLSFSKLFRHLLNWEGDLVGLEEELELVEKYLSIQKYRFQDRISYQIAFPPHLKNTLIPKLTIQPLVENAVKHGIESIGGTALISITVVEGDNDTMQIVVEDNGMGIPPVKLVAIQRELASEEMKKSGSIGLKNVHDRIALHFGAGYGIAIGGNEPTGTRVVVLLPIQYPL
ncbi:sensor histidine kinase [Paenibacillus nasutitermitis]|uniref:HAMP domain-containing protein n=1 Tax=Paenibacillus nasutitermitis TaxID=1652958 RepID=A0A916YM00_9BACL|nr:histidine kinase [Paenibacillus nasutitermitis]GGD49157.1 hypothetical protein GCM10010911_03370 [Paenibacillus nasutitermitis]